MERAVRVHHRLHNFDSHGNQFCVTHPGPQTSDFLESREVQPLRIFGARLPRRGVEGIRSCWIYADFMDATPRFVRGRFYNGSPHHQSTDGPNHATARRNRCEKGTEREKHRRVKSFLNVHFPLHFKRRIETRVKEVTLCHMKTE